jgi:hypothetical protein
MHQVINPEIEIPHFGGSGERPEGYFETVKGPGPGSYEGKKTSFPTPQAKTKLNQVNLNDKQSIQQHLEA